MLMVKYSFLHQASIQLANPATLSNKGMMQDNQYGHRNFEIIYKGSFSIVREYAPVMSPALA
jgi:hypothetical protein